MDGYTGGNLEGEVKWSDSVDQPLKNLFSLAGDQNVGLDDPGHKRADQSKWLLLRTRKSDPRFDTEIDVDDGQRLTKNLF